jgi:hypothetical protein
MTREERATAVAEKRQFWKSHIEGWQASGVSQTEYCRRNQLSFHRFVYWRKKYGPPPTSRKASLVEIDLSGGFHNLLPVQPSRMRLVVDNRHSIEVERDFDPVALQQLLQVLDNR